ncbi:J domain-containing protein [Aphelenchoides besseyi]|nr:J domain-containing protein [Aphelenchoides besseyi]
MIEITLRSFLSEFNGSKFIVYSSLLAFTILLALKLDAIITASFVVIFIPLWIAELVVLVGFFVGFVGFCMSPPARADAGSRVDFICMCLCMIQHLLLVAFEVLCCYKLEFINEETPGEDISWCFVFTPLFIQSLFAMVVSVYCIRHDKSFEFEMFFAINVVQFVFIAFKLDNALHWSWVIVFVPTWILFSLCVVGTMYSLIIAVFLSRSLFILNQQRRTQIFNSICHLMLAAPLITFFVLLTSKLDALRWIHERPTQLSYLIVSIPLFISLSLLVFMAFGNRHGNTWWFAMRKPFCNFVFDAFPLLRQYANISYRIGSVDETVERPSRGIGCDEPLCNGPPRTLSSIRVATQLWFVDCIFKNQRFQMNSTNNKVLLLGDSGVGKSTLTNTLCATPDCRPESTVGVSIKVLAHQFAAGTPQESTEIIELWDVGGTLMHRQTAARVFTENVAGLIFIHDLSNTRSEKNLTQWAQLLDYIKPGLPSPQRFNEFNKMTDIVENVGYLPTLVVGSCLDLAPHRGTREGTTPKLGSIRHFESIALDCRREITPASTNRLLISRFFDAVCVVKSKSEDPVANQRRRRYL